MAAQSRPETVCVGVIVGAQGVRGAVRVKSFTADPLDVAAYGPVSDEQGKRSFRLKVVGEAKGVVICTIAGVTDRDAAEALKGVTLHVDRASLPEPEEDEFYHADLIGLAAELSDGSPFGRVRGIYDFGAGDVIEIGRNDGTVIMLPFTKAVVPMVDVKAGRLVVEPPPEVEAKPEGGAEEAGEEEGEDGR
ncbi:ribosome maturation factor RimM [Telmatospirillum sp. J64-1]|uniref:ribosome maturation factor RimM n=1 Tax=Telmatospirillum sp. J64-1 TaxID=2502183 RepID=UPI00115E4AB6|nr:ribosome maturation factor RimM [Telmatospirillum sp. J64-1]